MKNKATKTDLDINKYQTKKLIKQRNRIDVWHPQPLINKINKK
jgi:hypothetical protein